MERRFFALNADRYVKGRWYLSDPTDADGKEIDELWRFSEGRTVELRETLRIPIYRPGEPLDFELAGNTPIVSERVAAIFRELAPDDVQLFPVTVDGHPGPFFLLNITRLIPCIDDAACREVQYFSADEELDAAQAGEYRSVAGLRIDKSRVGKTRAFRLWGWYMPIIVDEDLKDALEANGIFGGKFEEV
ncbi:imm11 family protein [Myxococcus stipitatus]|uniref:imm11 family protein n=1 Tax=Myxococcus stipitatus TaxID=83455 RepID=UPI0030D5A0D7